MCFRLFGIELLPSGGPLWLGLSCQGLSFTGGSHPLTASHSWSAITCIVCINEFSVAFCKPAPVSFS